MAIDKTDYMDTLLARGRYTSVANEILEIDISTHAKIIFIYLISKPSKWVSSRNNISNNLNMSRSTVTDALKELANRSMISISSRSDNSWDIKIYCPENWNKSLSNKAPGSKEGIAPGSKEGIASALNCTTPNISKREREESEEKLSIDDIYRVWLSSLPERMEFTACQEELRVLFETLKANDYSAVDLRSTFKSKVLKRWEKSKYPERQEQIWDRLIGEIMLDEVELSDPIDRPSKLKSKKPKGKEGEVDIDYAIRITTDDEAVQRMMEEYERIKSGDSEDGK